MATSLSDKTSPGSRDVGSYIINDQSEVIHIDPGWGNIMTFVRELGTTKVSSLVRRMQDDWHHSVRSYVPKTELNLSPKGR